MSAASGIQYLTTGSAGNRIFILQWSNVLCDFGAAAPALSFQLRLYETTNKIEFIYNQLAGMVQDFSGGASIGITGATTGTGSYLSLNNSSASPAISSVAATNNIITKPASGQVYVFTPQGCIAPGNLNATGITTTGASISWTDGSATAFEYAVTTSAIPPASGTTTSFTSAFAGGLEAGTQYTCMFVKTVPVQLADGPAILLLHYVMLLLFPMQCPYHPLYPRHYRFAPLPVMITRMVIRGEHILQGAQAGQTR
ncbi:MAG: hypothetical protein WDO16_08670 [Bacteroidota bacterium]